MKRFERKRVFIHNVQVLCIIFYKEEYSEQFLCNDLGLPHISRRISFASGWFSSRSTKIQSDFMRTMMIYEQLCKDCTTCDITPHEYFLTHEQLHKVCMSSTSVQLMNNSRSVEASNRFHQLRTKLHNSLFSYAAASFFFLFIFILPPPLICHYHQMLTLRHSGETISL